MGRWPATVYALALLGPRVPDASRWQAHVESLGFTVVFRGLASASRIVALDPEPIAATLELDVETSDDGVELVLSVTGDRAAELAWIAVASAAALVGGEVEDRQTGELWGAADAVEQARAWVRGDADTAFTDTEPSAPADSPAEAVNAAEIRAFLERLLPSVAVVDVADQGDELGVFIDVARSGSLPAAQVEALSAELTARFGSGRPVRVSQIVAWRPS